MLAICAIWLAALACTDPPPPSHTGLVGGRVLIAPGAGLAGARVVIDQVNLYDGKAELRKHVGETITDDQGFFPALSTGTINGLILIDASGGAYTDPINGARIQLDPSVHLKALHWLGVFEDRSETMYVTPVHALTEARFRYKMTVLGDPLKAMTDAFMHLNTHFGGLDWDKVAPADLGVAAASPTDEVRAAFVLGGLDMLVEDIRMASHSTPQVVNLLTWVEAAERDLSDPWLDGNDANASAFGSGLQVGDCSPVDATCAAPPDGCQLGACRPLCDLYANTYRSITADSISRFIGPKASPSPWNRTTLGSEDARAFTDGITRNADPDLFQDACVETQHHSPPIIVWETAPPDGALQGGKLTLRVHAVAGDSNKLPTVSFPSYQDTDGDPTNDFATVTIDTGSVTGGVDGPLTVTAVATDLAGNRATSTRTFQIDNTPPTVTLDSSGLYVGGGNVWWAATPRPTLHGTVGDAHPGMVQVVVGGSVVATAEVNGTAWSAQLPESALSSSGNDVTVVATDQVGNAASKVQALRLDTTPPSVAVNQSRVFDETNSTFSWDDLNGHLAVHATHGGPVDLAIAGACPTISKHAHLLFAPRPDGSHAVPGSSGELNPLLINVAASDDGVGIQPGSVQYRVLINDGTKLDEVLPWTAMQPNGTNYLVPLYRDTIPQLGTTNGEYHVQLRATDRFGRTTTQERCWNHVVLAPPLRDTSAAPGGEPATGFQRALWSTKLDPGPGETGDFAEKFLNANAAGGAVWRARFKNYLALPVYVTVQIPQNDVSATIHREFRIMKSLTDFRSPSHMISCGARGVHCDLMKSKVEYNSDFNVSVTQTGLKFQGRLFVMNGNETAAEAAASCADSPPPCMVTRNDATQTYVFQIPARASQEPLPEYAFLTYLDPTSPAGNGTNVTLAPSDASHPDNDPTPYAEFSFPPGRNGSPILTGKVMGPPAGEVCVHEFPTDNGEFVCDGAASQQEYRALVKIHYQFNNRVMTTYLFAAAPSLVFGSEITGTLEKDTGVLHTEESVLP